MAEINTPEHGKKHASKTIARSLRVDMTPMVDLGFLLITFFVFTAVVNKPTAMKFILPAEGDPTHVPVTKTLTVLLDQTDAVCYEGFLHDNPRIHTVNMTAGGNELRDIITAKQKALGAARISPDSLIVVIKPGENSNYRQLVAVLDEMMICDVKRHALGNMEPGDRNLLNGKP
ncbi:MAG: biopolymer transporter ExbD [Chitinophagaceae bacterium]|nr:biopolymer transporter ExbD [Chitinophagaceae bacterium]